MLFEADETSKNGFGWVYLLKRWGLFTSATESVCLTWVWALNSPN
jgi:hypothetical protein